MLSPAAMFIEMGADGLKSLPAWLAESQRMELRSFGDVRAQQLGATGLSDDLVKGYELGLATARALIASSPAASLGGHPDQIL